MTFTKDPDAILDYAVDWGRWLAGDTIAASVWLVPTGLTNVSETNTATKAIVWLSGGSAGVTYTVTNRITTAAGRTEDRSFTVRVEER
jgi:TRAP-type uncharacterized transport system substrate-binding protein